VSRKTLNLGILAHVDAGKTTLSERLLYAAGAIDAMGSVDEGTTRTDSLALERQRGITIKTAVASFALGETVVNLIDTPGHPDFIAEVERVLGILDGAVLVMSAVEGVQPQTRILFRALRRLKVPSLIFVNKIDRLGASEERTIAAISARLTPAIVPLGTVAHIGTAAAGYTACGTSDHLFIARLTSVLSDNDDELLADYVNNSPSVTPGRLRKALVDQSHRTIVYPVLFGSAITGAGTRELNEAIVDLLPSAPAQSADSLSADVFKIERGRARDRVAYARIRSGTLHTRSRVRIGARAEGKVTAIHVFDGGLPEARSIAGAGQITKLWGLREVRVGDAITGPDDLADGGEGKADDGKTFHFAPPTLEAVVEPVDLADKTRLRVALGELADQDPLINFRQGAGGRDLCVSLYGEVQKEVIGATLAKDYLLDVSFSDTRPLCIERLVGAGEAVEVLHGETNPYLATIGLRVEPARPGAGVEFRADVDPRSMPLYLYKTAENFVDHMRRFIEEAISEGLSGWRVTDCVITLYRCAYSVADGPPSRRGPTSSPADFRNLTPIVARQAVAAAGTVVCEPIVRVDLEIPTDTLRAMTAALAGAAVESATTTGDLTRLTTVLSVTRAQELQRSLAHLTAGEGAMESSFCGYAPVRGELTPGDRDRVGRVRSGP
jgi:ribosomal protection tetracycline resistance protein